MFVLLGKLEKQNAKPTSRVQVEFENTWRPSKLLPGWCGSVDWVPAYESKGCQFDSQSGHVPGFGARSPIGSM